LGAVRVFCLCGPALEVRGDGGGDGTHLALVRDGELVLEQAGRTVRAAAGGLAVLDSGRPYRVRLAGEWNGVVAVHLATCARARGTAGRPGSEAERPGEPPEQPLLAAVLAGFLAGLADDVILSYRPGVDALLDRVQGYILRHLGDDGLTPDRVAAAHHISTRYLHRLFQGQGLTVASWIKGQRLERCRRDLGDPGLCHLPVHVIGARWGFGQAAAFSRAFRGAYGTTPTCFRAAGPAVRVRSLPRNSARGANDRRVPAQQTPGHDEARQVPASVHKGDPHG
jgi:AraC-like DNA-binding protein